MTSRPHELAIVKAAGIYHAATATATLCNLTTFEPQTQPSYEWRNGTRHTEHTIAAWPKHWPAADTHKACPRCLSSATLLWRRTDRAPNAQLDAASTDIKRLARELTPALADARDTLGAIGYPTSSNDRRGTASTSDDTGEDALTVAGITNWIEDVRDTRDRLISTVRELDRLLARSRRTARNTIQTCGQVQQAMSADGIDGFTLDITCTAQPARSNGLCPRCGKRYDRSTSDAA